MVTDTCSKTTVILVAEDDEKNRRLLRDVLTLAGYAVVEATNGREAVAAARACAPDLILMDIRMPEMDGLEATRQLKAHPATRDIPIVAVSASVMPTAKAEALECGCSACVDKPIDLAALRATLASLLEA